MRELTSIDQVTDACGDDDLIMWAAQGMKPGIRAWAHRDAVAVASPHASRRHRLAVAGRPEHAVPLVRHALAEVGRRFRPFGDAELIDAVAHAIPELDKPHHFSWMTLRELTPPEPGRGPGDRSDGVEPPAWLRPEDDPQVDLLLKEASPESYAVPGIPGVRRWAGIRSTTGELLAVAADAWSAPTVGLLAGVATAVPARGRGLGERICRFVVEELLATYGRASLMVDDWNAAAIRVYERIGFARRPVAAARFPQPGGHDLFDD